MITRMHTTNKLSGEQRSDSRIKHTTVWTPGERAPQRLQYPHAGKTNRFSGIWRETPQSVGATPCGRPGAVTWDCPYPAKSQRANKQSAQRT